MTRTTVRLFFLMDYYCHDLGSMIGETYEPDAPSRVLRIGRAVRYTQQILTGLECLHDAGITHRDIKPYNVLISDEDMVKITDFGLSRQRGETFAGPSNLKVGSPFYAPPEQEENPDSADHRSDLYATGVLLLRLLTGRLPQGEVEAELENVPEMDDAWRRFLMTAVERDPERRFINAGQMRRELASLAKAWEAKKTGECLFFARTSPGGTEYAVTWHQAHRYVNRLNEDGFAGRSDWRLPTVSELITLVMEASQEEDFCTDPVFGRSQRWLWSADRRSYIAAWYVNVHLGFVAWNDFTAYLHVRAVTTLRGLTQSREARKRE
ncbi:DUF1566 domain-containing protein [Thermodesulfobacteriota bacterium]